MQSILESRDQIAITIFDDVQQNIFMEFLIFAHLHKHAKKEAISSIRSGE